MRRVQGPMNVEERLERCDIDIVGLKMEEEAVSQEVQDVKKRKKTSKWIVPRAFRKKKKSL